MIVLLESVEISYISPCLADPSKIRLKALFPRDISEVFPYLNARIKHAMYNHEGENISLYREFRLITLYPEEMTIIKALNSTDAWQTIDWLQELINDTYARRDEIEPDYRLKRRAHPLQLYAWLPQSNCRKCGEWTCLAFAAMIFSGQQKLERCEPLKETRYREHREVLLELARTLGA